jgi:pimeloyl-ACP methyl ester carboxylesterase
MSFVVANGVRFHAQRLGQNGPWTVMLHGLLIGSLASWYFTTAARLAGAHRVFLYDLRGHGLSERTKTGYDTVTQSADLDALMLQHDAHPVNLVGHSYGGLVALRYALLHPERVQRLVLVDVPLPASLMAGFHEHDLPSPEALFNALPPPLQNAIVGGKRQARRLFESLSFLLTESTLMADVRQEPDIPDAELARLGMPVLCLFGERSSCLPAGERLQRVLAHASLTVLPCGHYVPYEAEAAMTHHISEFVKCPLPT